MNNRKKRLLLICPLALFSTVVISQFIIHPALTHYCTYSLEKTLKWSDWLMGSSSAQFHFIDLLELISAI